MIAKKEIRNIFINEKLKAKDESRGRGWKMNLLKFKERDSELLEL